MARLSGSVSEFWSSPVSSSGSSIAWQRARRARTAAIFSARPFTRAPVVAGSVRARASKYSLCFRTCGDVPSRGFQDGQHGHGAAEELESAAIGGNMLVMAGARAEEVAEFVVSSAEPGC